MLNKMLLQITFASLVTASAIATAATTEPLKMEVYNPGEKVSSQCLLKLSVEKRSGTD